jgi:hypothetical protein
VVETKIRIKNDEQSSERLHCDEALLPAVFSGADLFAEDFDP